MEVLASGRGEFRAPDPNGFRQYVRKHKPKGLINKVMSEHEAIKKFVKKPDIISSPGYIDGSPDARERAGMPGGTGPYRVVTGIAMFGYDDETRRMKLLAIAPRVTVEDVLAKMDFEPVMPEKVEHMETPTEEELDILRVVIDPMGQTIGQGEWISV